MDIKEIQNAIDEHGKAVQAKLNDYETKLAESGSVSAEVKADLKAMAKDFEGYAADLKNVTDELNALQQNSTILSNQNAPVESLGQMFAGSQELADFAAKRNSKAAVEFQNNTIIGETGGQPTDDIVPKQNMPGIVGGAFRALRFLDIVPTGVATGNQIHYTRELNFDNNSAETAEGAQKPESNLTFEPVDTPVRTIAHFLKASRQVLDDAPQLMTYIDVRLRHGVRNRAERQLIQGDGLGQNIGGILAAGNNTNVAPAAGINDLFDYANQLKYAVVGADYTPDVYLVNPADWGTVERLKGTDGQYVGAGSAVSYLQSGQVPLLWGIPVLPSNNVPQGKLICASLDALMFWQRQAVTIEMFDQNQNDVETNLVTIRGEMRGAFTVFRPDAVVQGDIPVAP